MSKIRINSEAEGQMHVICLLEQILNQLVIISSATHILATNQDCEAYLKMLKTVNDSTEQDLAKSRATIKTF